MEIKYCDNCGKEICYRLTTRGIIVNDGKFIKHYEIDLCDGCFRKLDKHIRQTVARYKDRGRR